MTRSLPLGSDGKHLCPKLGCSNRVPAEIFACRSHWFALPSHVRNRIWREYREHGIGSPELTAAHEAAYRAWGDEHA